MDKKPAADISCKTHTEQSGAVFEHDSVLLNVDFTRNVKTTGFKEFASAGETDVKVWVVVWVHCIIKPQ